MFLQLSGLAVAVPPPAAWRADRVKERYKAKYVYISVELLLVGLIYQFLYSVHIRHYERIHAGHAATQRADYDRPSTF